VENQVLADFAAQGITGRALMRALRKPQADAIELLDQLSKPAAERDAARVAALQADPLVQYVWLSALCNVLCPATKLWDTGYGANMLREAVSLMGGYGITEDCPGFLFYKWTDAQLEATYEGPEVVQRRQISVTMNNEVFLAQVAQWMAELRQQNAAAPGNGLDTLTEGFALWRWTRDFIHASKDAEGRPLSQSQRHGVLFPMADAISWLLAARSLVADIQELAAKGPEHPVVGSEIAGYVNTFTDLAHMQIARAVGETCRICGELVYGYGAATAEQSAEFQALRAKADIAMAGARLAKDRAARALVYVMIPEALDYPQ